MAPDPLQFHVGRYSNISAGRPEYPPLEIGGPPPSDKQAILRYLKGGQVSSAAGCFYSDAFSPTRRMREGLLTLTDGAWFWRNDIVYYFEQYDAVLPEAFLQHIRARIASGIV